MSDRRIVDVWMQHPTPRFAEQPSFASLLRWTLGGSAERVFRL